MSTVLGITQAKLHGGSLSGSRSASCRHHIWLCSDLGLRISVLQDVTRSRQCEGAKLDEAEKDRDHIQDELKQLEPIVDQLWHKAVSKSMYNSQTSEKIKELVHSIKSCSW